jgi:hypothetical protein
MKFFLETASQLSIKDQRPFETLKLAREEFKMKVSEIK